jgi:hypothetical protein
MLWTNKNGEPWLRMITRAQTRMGFHSWQQYSTEYIKILYAFAQRSTA